MGDGNICFNSELLGKYDQEANWYRDAVIEITNGEMPTAGEPCVPEHLVSTSFKMSDLDPKNAADVLGYIHDRPYFQTAACYFGWAKSEHWSSQNSPEEVARKFIPAVVDPARWQKEPEKVLSEFDKNEDWLTKSATLAFQLTNAPITDSMLHGINTVMPVNCESFSVIEMHRATDDIVLKNQYAERLLEDFHSKQRMFYDSNRGLDDGRNTVVAVAREPWPALTGIFYEYFINVDGERTAWQRTKTADALIALDGTSAMAYMKDLALTAKSWGGSKYASAALNALKSAAVKRHDAIPFVIEILQDKGKESEFARETFWKRISGRKEIVADERLLPVTYWKIVELKGLSHDDIDSESLLGYMSRVGAPAVPYFRALVTNTDFELTEYFRQKVMEKLAGMSAPAAQAFLKSYVKYKKRPPEGPYKSSVLVAMAGSYNSTSQQSLLELLDEAKDDPELLREVIPSFANVSSRSAVVRQFFSRLIRVAEEHEDDGIKKVARSTAGTLARDHEYLFTMAFPKLPIPEQKFLIDEFPIVAKADPKTLFRDLGTYYGNEKLSDEVQKHFDANLLTAIQMGMEEHGDNFDLVSYMTLPQLMSRQDAIWEAATAAKLSVKAALRVADHGGIPMKHRVHALKYIAKSNEEGIDDLLLNRYIRNPVWRDRLRGAAIDCLGERAKNPKYATGAKKALKSFLTVPKKLQDQAVDALKQAK